MNQQLKLFYDKIIYDNKVDTYIFHYAGAGYYEGKRFGDDLYYTGQNYHYTISEKTIDNIIKENEHSMKHYNMRID